MNECTYRIIFIFLILILITLFIHSSLSFSEDKTETMKWVGGKFTITDNSKFFGIILILSIPFYFLLKKLMFRKK